MKYACMIHMGLSYMAMMIFAVSPLGVQAAEAQIHTTGAGPIAKVAPGEFLPISIKLLNFGSQQRVDVDVSYEIIDAEGYGIYAANETVAVETTASFVKTIQIPPGTPSGRYSARSSIKYKDQDVPATTQFPFIVERKLFGIFESEFYLYGGITLLMSFIAGMTGYLWVKRRRQTRSAPIDYSHIPRSQRVFYELVSDTIAQMRQHVGDRALEVAKSIEGLRIDENTGRVLGLKKSPARIMALLIQKYETLLGQKVNFAFSSDGKAKGRQAGVGKNLIIIKKDLD